jgi:hypothetical protein
MGKLKETHNIATEVKAHFKSLGFLINLEKSNLALEKVQKYLGFEFSTKSM